MATLFDETNEPPRIRALFVHGAGMTAYAAERPLAQSLQAALGDDYQVRYPQMPEADRPSYDRWSALISCELAAASGPILLAGHSLGGSVLLKYLCVAPVHTPVAGLFLVAAPFWGAADWESPEFALRPGFAARLPADLPVYLYYSRSDKVVDYSHLQHYIDALPDAQVRRFDGRSHQFGNDLSAVAADMIGLIEQSAPLSPGRLQSMTV